MEYRKVVSVKAEMEDGVWEVVTVTTEIKDKVWGVEPVMVKLKDDVQEDCTSDRKDKILNKKRLYHELQR